MPNLIILAAVGAGAYFGYRWLKKQVRETALAAAKRPQPASQLHLIGPVKPVNWCGMKKRAFTAPRTRRRVLFRRRPIRRPRKQIAIGRHPEARRNALSGLHHYISRLEFENLRNR